MNLKYSVGALLSTIPTVDAAMRHLGSPPDNDPSTPGQGSCQAAVKPNRWKSMEECCPCVTEQNCVSLLGPIENFGECTRGMDCYKTAFTYPSSKGCEVELSAFHWMHEDGFQCQYSEVVPDVIYVLEEGGEYAFFQACGCAVYGFCTPGCGRRSRDLNTVEESRSHHRRAVKEESGVTIHVESQHDERVDWLNEHVVEMKQRMDTGKVPRAWDPLFKAYFENLEDIKLECASSEQNVRCTSTATSQCALDLVNAHALYHDEIAASIKENGTHEIKHAHEVPDSCK